MSQARVLGLLGAAVITVAAVAYAQTTVNPLPENAPVQTAPLNTVVEKATWGDVQAGQQKAGTCAACHGLDGNPPEGMSQYPRLAGMPERYIAQQLALFKSHERNTGMAAVMYPFAEPLTAQDMRDLGAYFQTQKARAGVADDTVIATGPNAGKKFYEVGEFLYRAGDQKRGIPACMACHGPMGEGNAGPAYPSVAGQMAPYAQRRLEEYRTGVGPANSATFQVMATVAKGLTDEEIGSLASYLQGLHPRADDMMASAAPAIAPAAPPVPTSMPKANQVTPEAEASPVTPAPESKAATESTTES